MLGFVRVKTPLFFFDLGFITNPKKRLSQSSFPQENSMNLLSSDALSTACLDQTYFRATSTNKTSMRQPEKTDSIKSLTVVKLKLNVGHFVKPY